MGLVEPQTLPPCARCGGEMLDQYASPPRCPLCSVRDLENRRAAAGWERSLVSSVDMPIFNRAGIPVEEEVVPGIVGTFAFAPAWAVLIQDVGSHRQNWNTLAHALACPSYRDRLTAAYGMGGRSAARALFLTEDP